MSVPVQHHGEICAICPCRFEERGLLQNTPLVLEQIAQHYFGDVNAVVVLSEIRLSNIGTIDYVLVRHPPMQAVVTDFVTVEFQSDSTTGTGGVVQGLRDFVAGQDVQSQTYRFGMNTYDTIKRSITQLLNKGIVYEAWGSKCYWVIEEYIHANLVKRYGIRNDGYVPEAASRFALYTLKPSGDCLTLAHSRYVSITVDDMYQAMRNNPDLPKKDKFIQLLTAKLRAKLGVKLT